MVGWANDESSVLYLLLDAISASSSLECFYSVIGQQKHTHTHTRLTSLFPGLPRWAGTKKVKPIWILLKQETVSGSGISWSICKSAPHSRQITTPAPHHSVFYRPDALPVGQPTVSEHWRQLIGQQKGKVKVPCPMRGIALSPFFRLWARRWINHWCMAIATSDLCLPSQLRGITASWLVPHYTAR